MRAIQVRPVAEVRERLSQTLALFRREGRAAEPVVFGSHRKPEAVLLPFAVYEELIERSERLQAAQLAARSVQVEVPGPFSSAHEEAVAAYVAGQIDADEMYERTLAKYRLP